LSQEELAKKINKSRTYITDRLRLLELPKEIQEDVARATLTAKHGRILLELRDKPELILDLARL